MKGFTTVEDLILLLERARQERDEARREICEYQPRYYGPNDVDAEARDVAERRGWDCYKG